MLNRTMVSILFLSIVLSANILSQERKPVPLFATVHLGIFNTDRENFSDVYSSNTGFVFGGGIGLQVSPLIALVVKASYFHKTGVPLVLTYSYNFSTGIITLVSEKKEGTASYTQWLVNAGLQVSVLDWKQFSLSANSGVLYSVVSEEQDASPSFSFSSSGKGIYGCFLGLNIGRDITDSPFSPFLEIQYNLTRSGLTEVFQPVGGHFGGMNISLGCKYYFNK